MKLKYCRCVKKISNFRFIEKPPSEVRVVPDEQTDMKVRNFFRSFAKASKNILRRKHKKSLVAMFGYSPEICPEQLRKLRNASPNTA